MFCWKLSLALGVACCTGLRPSLADDSSNEVSIRAEDGTVLIAAEQIRSYDWTTHTLTLAPQVGDELWAQLKGRLVSGVPFAVTIGEEVVYQGTFTTNVSSRSFSTPVIRVEPVQPESDADTFPIWLGYPSAQFFEGEDPRADPRLRDALEAAGKLTESESESAHSKWLAESLREMQTIKPGMTREQLLQVFQEEPGGISNRVQQRYAYRDCAYIKVDVRFEPVGSLEDRLAKSPNDRIRTISTPFLEWPISD